MNQISHPINKYIIKKTSKEIYFKKVSYISNTTFEMFFLLGNYERTCFVFPQGHLDKQLINYILTSKFILP